MTPPMIAPVLLLSSVPLLGLALGSVAQRVLTETWSREMSCPVDRVDGGVKVKDDAGIAVGGNDTIVGGLNVDDAEVQVVVFEIVRAAVGIAK